MLIGEAPAPWLLNARLYPLLCNFSLFKNRLLLNASRTWLSSESPLVPVAGELEEESLSVRTRSHCSVLPLLVEPEVGPRRRS